MEFSKAHLGELTSDLYPARDKWILIGGFLNFEDDYLKAIEELFSDPVHSQRRLIHVIKKWLERDEPSTLEELVGALVISDEQKLASNLQEKYNSVPAPKPGGSSESVVQFDLEHAVEAKKQLTSTFATIVLETKEELNEIMNVSEFCHTFLFGLSISPEMEDRKYFDQSQEKFSEQSTFDGLFLLLDMYWDYINHSLLECIVNMYGSVATKSKMKQFCIDVAMFRRSTTLKVFYELEWSQVHLEPPPGFKLKKIALHLTLDSTLEDVKHICHKVTDWFHLRDFTLRLVNVMSASIAIGWHIPFTAVNLLEAVDVSSGVLPPTSEAPAKFARSQSLSSIQHSERIPSTGRVPAYHRQLAVDPYLYDEEADDAAAREEAVKEGYILCRSLNIAITGAGGAGKSSTLSVLIGEKPPATYTSTDIHQNATRVASVSNPAECLIRAVESANRILLTGEKLTWLVGDGLLHLIASGAKAGLTISDIKDSADIAVSPTAVAEQHEIPVSNEPVEEPVVKPLWKLLPNVDHGLSALSTNNAPQIIPSIAEIIAKEVLSEAAGLMKHSSSEPLAEVDILHIIDSGGQLQFHEMVNKFIKNLHACMSVTDITIETTSKIVDQFFVDGKAVGKPYESQYTHEQLFKRSLQALQQQKHPPKLAFVATHPDQVDKADLPQRIQERNDWILDIAKRTGVEDQIIYNTSLRDLLFTIQAADPSEEDKATARRLLERFRDMFEDTALVEVQKIPLRRFLLEQTMRKLGKENRGIVSVSECYQIARVFNMPAESVHKALLYLSNRNLILYYPEIVDDIVFCEVQTPLTIITQLVQYSSKVRGECKLADIPDAKLDPGKHFKLATQASLTEDLLKHKAFCKHFDENLTPKKFLKLMDYLEIIAAISTHPPIEYIMPCILVEMGENELEKYRMKKVVGEPLLLYFGKWPQSGVFCSLIARLVSISNWKPLPFTDREPPCLFRNCMNFEPPDSPCTVTLIESFDSGFFEVHIRSALVSQYSALCLTVKQTLNDALKESSPKDAFFCPRDECLSSANPHKHAATVEGSASNGRYLRCCSTGEKCSMLPGHLNWFERALGSTVASKPEKISELDIKNAVSRINDWFELGEQLEMEFDVLEAIQITDEKYGIKRQRSKMVNTWLKGDTEPSWSKLCDALDRMGEKVVAQEIRAKHIPGPAADL